jgi:phosphoribosylglycinamide formyltransferase 1
MKIGFLASHNGSNMQAIIDGCKSGSLQAWPAVVVSNNSSSSALLCEKTQGIPKLHLSGITHPDPEVLDRAILNVMLEHGVDMIVLTGYMKKIGLRTFNEFQDVF